MIGGGQHLILAAGEGDTEFLIGVISGPLGANVKGKFLF